ncbi:putative fructosyl amino acid protein [Podospora fimiseda]|uniref:Fructosyl amino acid protein n=1 Tax=Podospora fimiseda TaxID=252190 RepID=A0AAN7GXZ0_9PEZI|nr:putative fructosyl amino acid protein [Podospora fimiseda]
MSTFSPAFPIPSSSSSSSSSSPRSSSSSSPRSSSSSSTFTNTSSILIIGSGVFGLGTAYALSRRDGFSGSITVVDRSNPSCPDTFFAPDAASIDTSRIVRADYADRAYASLCDEAQEVWRKQDKPSDLGAEGRYSEAGLLLVANDDGSSPAPAAAPTAGADEHKPIDKSRLTGMYYARMSWANVLSLASQDPLLAERIRELPNPEAIRAASGTGSCSGTWGYINHNSGWANAEASMAWLLDQVKQTGRVNFVPGTVVSLEHDETTVTGAKLSDGRVLSADLVMVAAGAWTGSLVDLQGQAIATGQTLGYINITEEEQDNLGKMPVILNLTTGLFIIPPVNRVLKVARHAYGYVNPIEVPVPPLPISPDSTPAATVSIPRTSYNDPKFSIPAEGAADLRVALREMVPQLQDRPFIKTRLCWYSDTRTGDFLIDYHPYWKNLFITTGDSGHAFKFMPVIGNKIVECIMGQCPQEFKGKWSWKQPDGRPLFTEDGSRGGKPGLILADELAKTEFMLDTSS